MKKGIRIFGNLVLQVLIFLILLLNMSYLWLHRMYGILSFDEILFHLNMPLKGTADHFIGSYITSALLPTIALFLVELIIVYFPAAYRYCLTIRWKGRERRIGIYPLRIPAPVWALALCVWMVVLVLVADRNIYIIDYVRGQLSASRLIEDEYVDPATANLKFPEKKRNLICIYMESAETSAQDKANGGVFDVNYIPEMTKLAKRNVSFSQSNLIEGAAVAPSCGWTIAGLTAETAGLPLKMFSQDVNNIMNRYDSYLPGATSLGELLEDQGYHNYFMVGSDFEFGGRKNYFTQHGNYESWDYLSAKEEGKIPQDYKVWWGYEDRKLYEFAKEKLLMLASEDRPFNFSMLTVDTHHPDGYVCPLCPDTYGDNQYANVWACASAQVYDFVKWIKKQDFYDNTTIVIYGDHCSMDVDFYGNIVYDRQIGGTERKVYNAIINSPVKPSHEKNRKFTTLDYFPTTLASIGVEIEGNRLGLGANLFSDEPTLSEKYGYQELFEQLKQKSNFYNKEIMYP